MPRKSSTSTMLCKTMCIGLGFVATVNAHIAAFAVGMYCKDGASGRKDLNAADPVTPLYQLTKKDWWFHHINKCDEHPPAPAEFLELPAGGSFTVELAANQAKTTLSYNGRDTTDWGDGNEHPDDYSDPNCIQSPLLHAQNHSMAAGTAFAISYQSDITKVNAENLAVFSVRYHTPWKRVTSYDVPAQLPKCPDGGCHCAWGWIPNGCGQPNMYHQAFKCKVTGNPTGTTPVGTAKPPVWCEDDPSKCVQGPKQMLYWNQADGNNITPNEPRDGGDRDLSGNFRSPAYNAKCGFKDGAQNDIFTGTPSNGGGSNAKPESSSGTTSSSNTDKASNSDTDTPSSSKSSTASSQSPVCKRENWRQRRQGRSSTSAAVAKRNPHPHAHANTKKRRLNGWFK